MTRPARLRAFASVEPRGQAHHEDLDALAPPELRELGEQPRPVTAVQVLTGMGHGAEIVGDGEPDPNRPEIDARGAHALSRVARTSRPRPAPGRCPGLEAAELDLTPGPEHKPGQIMQLRAVKGMNDLLPGEVERWQRLEQAFRQTLELFGYSEVRTPLVEHKDLFVHSTGEATEIVEKQMFEIARGDELLALRPEGTPGAARAYLSASVHAREPVTRWYYLGPMFRAEQPQRGRYRQFHQAGAELFGDPGPLCDAEMIDMLVGFLKSLGIEDLEVSLSSLGGPETRVQYRQALTEHLTPQAERLSEHARRRLADNPLRILDSKDPRDQEAVSGAPSILDFLTEPDREHHQGLLRALDRLETPYRVTPGLVRGLDYYARTAFEITSSSGELGAQNSLLGGGRYDALLEGLGGPALPGIGFALGMERVLLAMPEQAKIPVFSCFVAPLGERARTEALVLGRDLRRAGVRVEIDTRGGSLKSLLRRADALGASLCLLLGDQEIDRGVVQVKDLERHQQAEVSRSDVVRHVTDQRTRNEAGP